MLLGSLDLLRFSPLAFAFQLVLTVGALLACITVHEASHALVSFRLGDYTAKALGRLSLNPIRHLDPVGTVMLVLVGFGWGKPVPVNPHNVHGGRRGLAIVSAAGPVSNLMAASLFALPFRLGLLPWQPYLTSASLNALASTFIPMLFSLVVYFNIILAVFNLLPLFPLDGSKVLLGLLPERIAHEYAKLERYGPMILLLLFALDFLTNGRIISPVLGPMVNYLVRFIVG